MSADSSRVDAENLATPKTVRQPKKGRSAVSNGTALLAGVDGRSKHGRRFRDLVKALTAEFGRTPSVSDQNLIKQCAAMTLKGEMLQADIVNGIPVAADDFCRTTSEARRLTELLRSRGAAPRERAGPALSDYLAGRAA